MATDTPNSNPAQSCSTSERVNPHVLIVGAGVAGLFLAILLERAGIPYQVYERAKEAKPLGAVMSLNAGILPAFEQLGLYEELQKVSLRADSTFDIYYGDLSFAARISTRMGYEIGYNIAIFARTDLYDLLLARIPPGKIHFNKKVIAIDQNENGTRITCSDGTSYSGDILVGADGAYSGVRQELYKQMQEMRILPAVDTQAMDKGFICMVGTTRPLDPSEYPGVDDEVANINQIIGRNSSYCWSAFSVPGNRICWNVILQLSSVKEANENEFKNAEWSGDSSDPMIQEVRAFLIPFGNKTLGDLIDATPQDNVSKVFLEDKLFETWHHGRTVLIGDACHKLLPSAGLGAVTSMQDAVVLANCLYEMKGLSQDDINDTLIKFKEERYSRVKAQCEASRMNAKLLYGQSWIDRLLRTIVFNWLPESFRLRGNMKGLEFRPQATFLPQVPVRGIGYVVPQMVSQRYLNEQTKLKA